MRRIMIFTAALAMLFSACNTKDEPWTTVKEEGNLAVNVKANSPQAMTRAEISTADFAVDITGKGTLADVKRSFAKVSEMPAKVTLPVGSYTVAAHTQGDLERKMAIPYYMGEADVDIEADLTTNKEIACTMANSRISVKYSDEFLALFASWTVTIDDGTDQALLYTEEDKTPADVFWYFKNETKNLTVNIRAVTKKGNNVEASATYNKKNSEEGYTDIENECFAGGDAISINFMPIEPGKTTGTVKGIAIENNITFDEEDETVTLHLKDVGDEDEPSNPSDPSDPLTPADPITITEPNGTDYLATGVEYTQQWTEVDDNGIPYYLNCPAIALHFDVPNGLQHLYVKISGSEDFEFMTGLLGLGAEPYGLDLMDSTDENAAEIANMELFTMPQAGATAYDFAFSEGIWRLLPGFIGTQKFQLRAVDAQGNAKDATLVVTINEKQ